MRYIEGKIINNTLNIFPANSGKKNVLKIELSTIAEVKDIFFGKNDDTICIVSKKELEELTCDTEK